MRASVDEDIWVRHLMHAIVVMYDVHGLRVQDLVAVSIS